MPANRAVYSRQTDARAGEVLLGMQSLEWAENVLDVGHVETGDCSAQEGGQRWAHDDRGDPGGGQLVTDTALRRRRCSVMQPCGSRVEEGTRRCKHR